MAYLSNLENRLTSILIQENHDVVEREKIIFGVKLIVNDLWKLLIVYVIALCLDCFFATFITHFIFFMLRQVCFGFHFQNNFVCLVASIISLPIGVYLIKNINLDGSYIVFAAMFSTLLLLAIAPIGTKKRPVFNQKHRNYLRKKLFIRLFILWTIILIVNGYFQYFILYAIILIAVSVLTQKILGGVIHED